MTQAKDSSPEFYRAQCAALRRGSQARNPSIGIARPEGRRVLKAPFLASPPYWARAADLKCCAIRRSSSSQERHRIDQGINIRTVVVRRERDPDATVANTAHDVVAAQCVDCSLHAGFWVGERYYVG